MMNNAAQRSSSPRVTLRPITRDNLEDICRLRVAAAQREFVETNVGSIAEAYVEPSFRPFGVYSDEEPVGFTMYGYEDPPGRWWIVRLMIDERYQGKGFGRAAMRELIARMVEAEGSTSITTSFVPGNEIAERLYESLGFRKTGEIDAGEIVMVLDLGQDEGSQYGQEDRRQPVQGL